MQDCRDLRCTTVARPHRGRDHGPRREPGQNHARAAVRLFSHAPAGITQRGAPRTSRCPSAAHGEKQHRPDSTLSGGALYGAGSVETGQTGEGPHWGYPVHHGPPVRPTSILRGRGSIQGAPAVVVRGKKGEITELVRNAGRGEEGRERRPHLPPHAHMRERGPAMYRPLCPLLESCRCVRGCYRPLGRGPGPVPVLGIVVVPSVPPEMMNGPAMARISSGVCGASKASGNGESPTRLLR